MQEVAARLCDNCNSGKAEYWNGQERRRMTAVAIDPELFADGL